MKRISGMPRSNYCKIAALICVTASSHGALAQTQGINLYLQLGGGWGSANTVNIGVTAMHKRWAGTIDHVSQHRVASNIPYDYHPGLVIFGDGKPKTALEGNCLEGARVIYFANNHLRFLARGGLFWGTYSYPERFRQVSGGWFGPNYQYDVNSYDVIGLVLHPTIEWIGTVPFGTSTGIRLIITDPSPTIAIDFNLLLGKVRGSRKKVVKVVKPIEKPVNAGE